MERTPWGGQVRTSESDYPDLAFRRKPMAKHRPYLIEFKRQVVHDYLAGETLHGLAKRHDISRNLIRLWVAKH